MKTAEMDNLVKVRMGEALGEELRKDVNFNKGKMNEYKKWGCIILLM